MSSLFSWILGSGGTEGETQQNNMEIHVRNNILLSKLEYVRNKNVVNRIMETYYGDSDDFALSDRDTNDSLGDILGQENSIDKEGKDKGIEVLDEDDMLLEESLHEILSDYDQKTNKNSQNASLQDDHSGINPIKPSDTERNDIFYDCCEISEECECESGFKRKGFKEGKILNINHKREVYVYTGIKSTEWPEKVEDIDGIKELDKQLKGSKEKVKLFITDDEPTNQNTFDILISPDMIRFSGVTEDMYPSIVEYIKTKQIPSNLTSKKENGVHIFVCCHHKRDARCGTCGPRLVKSLTLYAQSCDDSLLSNLPESHRSVRVHRVSHLGGHKYAANLVIIRWNNHSAEYCSDWYSYVSVDDVPNIFKQHIAKGKVLAKLWRGRCGVSLEQSKKLQRFH